MKNLKTFIAGFLTCLLVTTGIWAAAPADVNVKAIVSNSIKMKLFGKDFLPKEADGTYVKPIIYNNRTYLPVKQLCDGVGVAVEWDAATKTVWIGGKTTIVPVDDVKMYEDYSRTILTKDADKLTTAATTYKWGIANSTVLNSVYYGCYLKPESKYKRFTASIFADGDFKYGTVLEFRKNDGKGEVIKSIALKSGETTDIDLDIGGVDKLYIFANVGSAQKLIIGEPTFRNDTQEVIQTNPAETVN